MQTLNQTFMSVDKDEELSGWDEFRSRKKIMKCNRNESTLQQKSLNCSKVMMLGYDEKVSKFTIHPLVACPKIVANSFSWKNYAP